MPKDEVNGITPESFDMAIEIVMTAKRVMRAHIREAEHFNGVAKKNMIECIISDANTGLKMIRFIEDHFHDEYIAYKCELDRMQYTFECQVALHSQLLGIQDVVHAISAM